MQYNYYIYFYLKIHTIIIRNLYIKTLISPNGQLLPYSRAKHKNCSLAHLWERVRVRTSTKTLPSPTCGRGCDKTLISPDGQLLPYSRAKHKNCSLAHLWERARVRAKHVNVGVKNPNLQI